MNYKDKVKIKATGEESTITMCLALGLNIDYLLENGHYYTEEELEFIESQEKEEENIPSSVFSKFSQVNITNERKS